MSKEKDKVIIFRLSSVELTIVDDYAKHKGITRSAALRQFIALISPRHKSYRFSEEDLVVKIEAGEL
jgi:hypothetical protein